MKINELLTALRRWDEGSFDLTREIEVRYRAPAKREREDTDWTRKELKTLRRCGFGAYGKLYPIMSVVLCAAMVGFLLLAVAGMPAFGSSEAPTLNEVTARYVGDGMRETGAVNLVAGLILDYRAFDTLGESHVLYTAVTAVLVLLQLGAAPAAKAGERLTDGDPVLRSTARIIVPMSVLFGFYVIFCGHLGPGGGFSGGAVVGGGLILYANAFGFARLEKILNMTSYRIVVLCALCFYSLSKCYSFFCGANGLESIFSPGTPGRILSAGLILPLNVAVGIVVACTMYGLYSLFQRGKI